MKKYKSDSGRSMMEVILYLSLIIVMTVASVKMYADYNEKIKRTKAQDQLETISENVSRLYFGKKFGTQKISLNDKLKEKNISIIDPWGKNYDVKTDNDTMYHITITANKANCIYLAMNGESKVREPVVNSSSDTTATPFTLCKDGDTNTVSFYYTIR